MPITLKLLALNPYIVRKTVGWDIDTETGKRK